jgi:uncharacterized protein involved in outer membrane biogenesis
MRKNLRRTLVWLGSALAFLVVLAIAAGLAVSVIDWNRAKPWLIARAQAASGRDVAIDGELRVAWHLDTSKRVHPWLPRLNVSATGITVGNAPHGREKTFATVKSLDFDLLPWALLYHEIALGSIHAQEPVLHLERYADNRNNWTFGADEEHPSTWKVRLGRIAFDAGKFDFDDATRKLHLDATITPLDEPQEFERVVREQEQHAHQHSNGKTGKHATAEVQDGGNDPRTKTAQRYRFAWKVTGKASGSAVSGSGKVGGTLGFRDDEEPWPVAGELTTGDTHIAVVGTLKNPTDLSALDLRLWLSGATLADLYPLLHLTLPQTKAFTTDGHLSGELHPDGNKFSYENFRGRIGDSDVAGSLTYDGRHDRSVLTGKVSSNLLQFADLGPLVGADGAGARDQNPDKTLPATHFHFERWRDMDASVDFAAKRLVRQQQLPISNIQTHIAMNGGVLTLKPLRFDIASGNADAELTVDGTVTPPKGSFQAAAHHLKLNALFPGFDLMEASVGEINGDLAFKTNGDSVARLLGNADGELKLVVDGGSISKAALEKAGLNLANFAIAQIAGDRQVRIDCAAADFGIDDGVLHSKLAFIDTEDALIRVEGTVSLADEKLDLTVHPDAKQVRLLSLRSPLKVTGTFKHPDAGLDKRSLLVRGGGALALAAVAPVAALVPLTATSSDADKGHSCSAVFARLRNSDSGTKSKR